MSLRVVLYAEGSGETGGELAFSRRPGDSLTHEQWGPAHILVGRLIQDLRQIPEAAIWFEEPLRFRGRLPRGSRLYDPKVLPRLLVWPQRRPDVAVVFVDRDGSVRRERELNEAIQDLRIPHALGVATESFESWLLADANAVVELLRPTASPSADPESLPPGEAKNVLQQWCVDAGQDPLSLRRDLAVFRGALPRYAMARDC